MDFYYSRKKLFGLFVLSLIVLFVAAFVARVLGMSSGVTTVIVFCPILFVLVSYFLWMFPRRLAHIDENSIQIDHSVPLMWKDVVAARKIVNKHMCGKSIVVFDLKPKVVYPLTFMQSFCQSTKFTAFSIPLYAMKCCPRCMARTASCYAPISCRTETPSAPPWRRLWR